jgi:hypothetical protein
MKDRTQSRLASVIAIIAGVWLLASPLWISMTGWSLTNIIIVGVIIGLAGLIQLLWINTVPSWVVILAAVWLFISAFIFDMSAAAVWNMVITAAVVFVDAIWDNIEVGHMQHGQHVRI